MLAAMENAKTGPKKLGDTVSPNSLEDLGITKKQSSRWQKEASVPDEVFEQLVSDCHLHRRCHKYVTDAKKPW